MQLRKPVDTGGQLDSTIAFRYFWLNFRILGMHPPQKRRMLYFIYAVFCIFICAFCMPLSLFINLFNINAMEQLIANLPLTMTIIIASSKTLTIFLHRESLLHTTEYLKKLDARCNPNTTDRLHILNAIRVCHIFYVVNTALFGFVAVGYCYIGISKHRLMYNGWFPTFFVDPEKNFHLASAYENIAVFFFIFHNVNSDTYPQCYIAVMIGHIRALGVRIEAIGKDPKCSAEENLTELLRCIQDHKDILRYYGCIRPVISRTISLQFLITAFELCLTAINFIIFDRDISRLLFTGIYLFDVSLESFPCCWFVNALVEESERLATAIYSCNWYEQDQRFRKILIFFMQRSQKMDVIMAGNLAPVTLQTFLALIRFAFSMFTILNSMKIQT